MRFPCPNKIQCPGGGDDTEFDPPIANLTSEQPDHAIEAGFGFGPFNAGGGVPPLGSTWTALGCASVCESTVSQEDADLCAQQQAAECTWNTWTQPGTGGTGGTGTGGGPSQPLAVYRNRLAQCAATCPDGSLFTWTVIAGQFSALSQALADRMAQSFACNKVLTHYFCLGDFTTPATVGTPYTSIAFITGPGAGPFLVELIAGTLPSGLLLSQGQKSAILAGTPTTIGSYTFTLRATDAGGNFIVKTYTIAVNGSETCATLWARMSFVDGSLLAGFSPPNVPSVVAQRVGNTLFLENHVIFDAASPAAQNLAQLTGQIVNTTANEITCQLTLNITQHSELGLGVTEQLVLIVDDWKTSQNLLTVVISPVLVQTNVYTVTIPAGFHAEIGFAIQVSTTGGKASTTDISANLVLGT